MRSVVQGRDPDPVRLPPVRVAAAQPSSVIPGRPSAAEEDCAFSREEVEVHATYTRSGMSRDEGDHMLRWATGPETRRSIARLNCRTFRRFWCTLCVYSVHTVHTFYQGCSRF